MLKEQTNQKLFGTEVIKQALENMPQTPGVYLMKDAGGKVLYVGKAKRLKSRVSSYARLDQSPTWYRQRIMNMVERVERVDFVVTGTEKEALLLESTLIKKHRPRYNVDMRDDKRYLLLRLGINHEYPRISLVRRPAEDGARYFGPFDKAGLARKTLNMLQRVFPLRRCTDHVLNNRSRPCLDHDTGRCAAPCTGLIDREDYRKLVEQMTAFFSGKGQAVADELKRQMLMASQDEDYELAASFRDRLLALERTLERQRVARTGGGDMDVAALHDAQGSYCLALLKVRSGRVVASRIWDLGAAALEPEEALGQALLGLYHQGNPPPPLILVSHMPPDPGLAVEVLGEAAGRRVELSRPQRGEKRGLLDLALMNAAQPREDKGPDVAKILARLGDKLNLPEPPHGIECVDISHLGGSLTVASLVAFAGGEPHKAGYRHYNVVGLGDVPDDYASMAQVVSRRLTGDRPPPDLLLLDGGKGQLNIGAKVLEQLPEERRPALASIAKGKDGGEDKIYLPGRKNPVNFKPRDPALLFLMRVRDEAHRFAITYHRRLRKKALTKSILEEIPGIGPKRRKKLLGVFGSLAALKRADALEIGEKAGLDQAAASRVAAFLSALDTSQPRK